MGKHQLTGKLPKPARPNLFSLLRPYRLWIVAMVVLTILGNALNLAVPKVMAHTIDNYGQPSFVLSNVLLNLRRI